MTSDAYYQFKQQIEMMDLLYMKLVQQCKEKCIPPPYRYGDLTKGESVCLDRCTAKYFQFFEAVGKALSKQEESV